MRLHLTEHNDSTGWIVSPKNTPVADSKKKHKSTTHRYARVVRDCQGGPGLPRTVLVLKNIIGQHGKS